MPTVEHATKMVALVPVPTIDTCAHSVYTLNTDQEKLLTGWTPTSQSIKFPHPGALIQALRAKHQAPHGMSRIFRWGSFRYDHPDWLCESLKIPVISCDSDRFKTHHLKDRWLHNPLIVAFNFPVAITQDTRTLRELVDKYGSIPTVSVPDNYSNSYYYQLKSTHSPGAFPKIGKSKNANAHVKRRKKLANQEATLLVNEAQINIVWSNRIVTAIPEHLTTFLKTYHGAPQWGAPFKPLSTHYNHKKARYEDNPEEAPQNWENLREHLAQIHKPHRKCHRRWRTVSLYWAETDPDTYHRFLSLWKPWLPGLRTRYHRTPRERLDNSTIRVPDTHRIGRKHSYHARTTRTLYEKIGFLLLKSVRDLKLREIPSPTPADTPVHGEKYERFEL